MATEENKRDYRFKIQCEMKKEDLNIFGTVHGGHIMKLMDDAASTLCAKHMSNAGDNEENQAVEIHLVRIEDVHFKKPVMESESCDISAEIIFTSKRSMFVKVNVTAINPKTGTERLTNSAGFWYVATKPDEPTRTLPVPGVQPQSSEWLKCQKLYQERQAALKSNGTPSNTVAGMKRQCSCDTLKKEDRTMDYSQTLLTKFLGENEVNEAGVCKNEVLLRMIDECAGIVAARHCRTRVATVSFDSFNFNERILKGTLLTTQAKATFVSERSMEVEVSVFTEIPWQPKFKKREVAKGHVTYVSLDDKHRPQPIPELKLVNDDEELQFSMGKERHGRKRLKKY